MSMFNTVNFFQEWSDRLEILSKDWANRCTFEHSTWQRRRLPGTESFLNKNHFQNFFWSIYFDIATQSTSHSASFYKELYYLLSAHSSWIDLVEKQTVIPSGLGAVGEHITAWSRTKRDGDIPRIVKDWFSEVSDFSYPNQCSGVTCGHYVGVRKIVLLHTCMPTTPFFSKLQTWLRSAKMNEMLLSRPSYCHGFERQ